MLSPTLFLRSPALWAAAFQPENTRLVTAVHSTRPSAICPDCGAPSTRIHSRYTRAPADLPVAGRPVTLQLRVRRFYCDRKACPRRTFSEPFSGLLARYQRRTQRLGQIVQALGLALGGEAGARLAGKLGVRLSPDTLLRAVRRSNLRQAPEPRVLGVDDWAFRRAHTYGTLLVDLERHRPIDLLPDRKAETLAAWLKRHPGIVLISRDRAGPYAEGARRGAPQARQVADRWHLLKNLREALERLLNRYGRELQWNAQPGAAVSVTPPEPDPEPRPTPLTRAERNRLANRERRLARYHTIVELRQQGWSIRAIAHHLHLQRVTVRRFLQADGFPERAIRKPVPSLVDPFRPYLQQRWQAGCHNARHLFREIALQGFLGSEALVRRVVHAWRSALPRTEAMPRGTAIAKATSVSPRQAFGCWTWQNRAIRTNTAANRRSWLSSVNGFRRSRRRAGSGPASYD